MVASLAPLWTVGAGRLRRWRRAAGRVEAVREGVGIAVPTSRHWRLLQALHGSRQGQLSRLLDGFGPSARDGIRHPHPEVFGVLDPRPLLDEAAMIAARYGGTGWLTAETLIAGLAHGNRLYFGLGANVGRLVSRAAGELGIAVQVIER